MAGIDELWPLSGGVKSCRLESITTEVDSIMRKSLRFYPIYKLMLCITGIQLSADIILTVYSLNGARKERDSVVLKCINISDVNIEKIIEILRNI
jgi:hypothetical protein